MHLFAFNPTAAMLGEYYNIGMDVDSRCLTSLPLIIDNHFIEKHQIPVLLLGLAINVNWEDECVSCDIYIYIYESS